MFVFQRIKLMTMKKLLLYLIHVHNRAMIKANMLVTLFQ